MRYFIRFTWGIYCSELTEMSHVLDNSLAVNIVIEDFRHKALQMKIHSNDQKLRKSTPGYLNRLENKILEICDKFQIMNCFQHSSCSKFIHPTIDLSSVCEWLVLSIRT